MNSLPLPNMSVREKDAYALTEAAVSLDRARGKAADLAAALEHNLELWVAIRTLVTTPGNALPAAIRHNLVQLSGFVAGVTLDDGVEMQESKLNTLININLQIAEGLLQRVHAVAA
jgi:flagellar biosynthesis regulator FlaF